MMKTVMGSSEPLSTLDASTNSGLRLGLDVFRGGRERAARHASRSFSCNRRANAASSAVGDRARAEPAGAAWAAAVALSRLRKWSTLSRIMSYLAR